MADRVGQDPQRFAEQGSVGSEQEQCDDQQNPRRAYRDADPNRDAQQHVHVRSVKRIESHRGRLGESKGPSFPRTLVKLHRDSLRKEQGCA